MNADTEYFYLYLVINMYIIQKDMSLKYATKF